MNWNWIKRLIRYWKRKKLRKNVLDEITDTIEQTNIDPGKMDDTVLSEWVKRLVKKY